MFARQAVSQEEIAVTCGDYQVSNYLLTLRHVGFSCNELVDDEPLHEQWEFCERRINSKLWVLASARLVNAPLPLHQLRLCGYICGHDCAL